MPLPLIISMRHVADYWMAINYLALFPATSVPTYCKTCKCQVAVVIMAAELMIFVTTNPTPNELELTGVRVRGLG